MLLQTVLAVVLLPALALSAPVELDPRASKYTLKPLFGRQSFANGSTVQLSQLLLTATYYLESSGSPEIDAKFSIIVGGDAGSSTLVAGCGGQRAVGLFGKYLLGLPTRVYASLSLPSIPRGSAPVQICTYVFEEPSKVGSASPSRSHFELEAFIKQTGLEGPVAAFCLKVGNGPVPSASSSATASASKSSSAAAVSSTTASTSSTASDVSSASPTVSSTVSVASSMSTASSIASSTLPSGFPTSVSASTALSMSASSSSSLWASSSTSASASASTSVTATATGPNSAYATTVTFNGQTYTNKGLVGFGAIDPTALDSTGLTIGGIGSAIGLKSISRSPDGTYSGEMYVQPDRGHNTANTVDYVARRHIISFRLNPYYDETKLEYEAAKSTFQLKYESTLLYTEGDGIPTTGIDPTTYRNGSVHYPIASIEHDEISTDAEGLVVNADGTSWVSDEYGPYIYKYSADGKLLDTIVPPSATLPMLNGSLYFSANSDIGPTTGRAQNQGFEGVTASSDGKTLYALMQSGLVQDVAESAFARFYAWDVTASPAVLKNAYVLQLPVTEGKGKTLAQSDVQYISEGVFMVLSRDGKGNGNDDAESKHKDFLLYTTDGATDIANTNYTNGVVPVAKKGALVSGLTAMQPTKFIDMIDEMQLERFGLHNNSPFSASLINGKWEGATLASIQDPAFPDDYFLFAFSDNDFITLDGIDPSGRYQDAYAVSAGYSLDNQALVWRVTLPGRA